MQQSQQQQQQQRERTQSSDTGAMGRGWKSGVPFFLFFSIKWSHHTTTTHHRIHTHSCQQSADTRQRDNNTTHAGKYEIQASGGGPGNEVGETVMKTKKKKNDEWEHKNKELSLSSLPLTLGRTLNLIVVVTEVNDGANFSWRRGSVPPLIFCSSLLLLFFFFSLPLLLSSSFLSSDFCLLFVHSFVQYKTILT